MTESRYLIRTRYPQRQGRRILGVAVGPKPSAYDEAVLLEHAQTRSDVPDDAAPVLTLTPQLRKSGRKGRHEVGARLAAGVCVDRTAASRFALTVPGGRPLGTVQLKYLPHRMRIETPDGARVRLRNRRATMNVMSAVKRSATGELLATWEGDDGLRIEYHGGHGYAIVDDARWPFDLRLALVAAMVGVEFSIDPSDIGD